jgi:hypothetical protein
MLFSGDRNVPAGAGGREQQKPGDKMKSKDLMTIGTVALGTAAVTVAAMLGGSMEAGNGPDGTTAQITHPTFLTHGVRVSVAPAEDRIWKAGDEPVFTLNAVNESQAPTTAVLKVSMTATAPAGYISRMVSMPAVQWQDTLTLSLKPGETRTMKLETHKALAPNKLFGVNVQDAAPVEKLPGDTASAPVSKRAGSFYGMSLMTFSTSTAKAASGTPPSFYVVQK